MRDALILPWRLARRELRGGLRGFRIFTACLALGVGAIAAVGSLSAAVQTGLHEDARKILGGDVEVRRVHLPVPADVAAALDQAGTVSGTVEMRAMASPAGAADNGANGKRLLVELKAVDDFYPLYGAIDTSPAGPVPAALAHKDGLGGALVDPDVLRRLKLKIGDTLDIGDATFRIAGTIDREPDRGTRVFIFGPRVMIAARDLKATGLVQLGSMINYYYRVRLNPGTNATTWTEQLRAGFPDAPWQVRGLSGAAPGMQRFVDRITLYLTLVGLTALLVGGVGVANSVKSYLDGRTRTIATLKCLGAPAALIFRTYMVQIAILAGVGIAIGLAVGTVAPLALVKLVEAQLPVPARLGVYAGPLLLAAAYGVLTALTFSLWPLARARDVAPAALFRDLVAPTRRLPPWTYQAATAVLLAALAGLAWATAPDRRLAAWFVVAAAGSFVAFRVAAWLIARAAALINKPAGRFGPRLRLALANLHRPGAPTGSVVLSLGLGLTVLVAIALIQANLQRQVEEQLPAVAPTFFFIDIQSNEIGAFDAALKSVKGVEEVQEMPSLRARIVRINGVPADQANVAKQAAWAVDSDRGLTYAATPPPGSRVVEGQWWPADYKGPPLISFESGLAAGMGVGIGDTLTFNVLGREIEARIGNLRSIDWTTLGMNFTVIFAPGTLEQAPHTFIATVRAAPGQEAAVLEAVTQRLPNVSAVRVKDALDAVNQILGNIGLAVNAAAVVTLLAGALVLAGAIAAGHRRRVYDAVVLKVLGATRRDVLGAYLVEYGCLGLATAAIAAVLGTGVAYFVITEIMNAPWVFFPENVAATALLCLAITVVFGFIGTWRALSQKAATLLRNE